MELTQKKCVPCEVGAMPLSRDAAEAMVAQVIGWELSAERTMISKVFIFSDFKEAFAFAGRIKDIAESEGHHPDLTISWGLVRVELSTHSIRGLSENDFILAAKINALD